ncbi:hypothetical protein [Pedobacter frigidisoli]|uniref:hypothetical protein n=1 Tax=Pedobacter frigidisoli TaxID=2530455 RepID=UPI002930C4BE|nr:hypothetical protein [Pedobacter frigidisoli]
MKVIAPGLKIMTTEPIVNIVPSLDAIMEMVLQAAQQHDEQYQATAMLTGKICEELGKPSSRSEMERFI